MHRATLQRDFLNRGLQIYMQRAFNIIHFQTLKKQKTIFPQIPLCSYIVDPGVSVVLCVCYYPLPFLTFILLVLLQIILCLRCLDAVSAVSASDPFVFVDADGSVSAWIS